MNWTKASAIAEILSAMAILVTLVFLVIQMQQNTAAIQANTRTTGSSDFLLLSQMENPAIWAAMHNSEYTDEQKVYFNSWLVAALATRETDWLNHQSGTLDDRSWRRSENALRQIFTTPMFRTWWNNVATEVYHPEFVALVDAIIAESPPRSDNNILRTFD